MATYSPKYANLDQAVADEVKARIAVARGVTIKSAADALDIRRATLSARINGHAPFSLSLLGQVAGLLGTTATEITAAAERRRALALGEGQQDPGATTREVAAS